MIKAVRNLLAEQKVLNVIIKKIYLPYLSIRISHISVLIIGREWVYNRLLQKSPQYYNNTVWVDTVAKEPSK